MACGLSWAEPVTIAEGRGLGKRQVFNDKPWITADTNPSSPYYGRLYVTWDKLSTTGNDFASHASYGPTMESQSDDDGGLTWSEPRRISGRNRRYCTYTGLGTKKGSCARGYFTTGVVDRKGVVTIAFLNPQNEAA